jgi:hypothetical protein
VQQFDHLLGANQQLVRDGEAEPAGGLMIDDQLQFGRLQNRQNSAWASDDLRPSMPSPAAALAPQAATLSRRLQEA